MSIDSVVDKTEINVKELEEIKIEDKSFFLDPLRDITPEIEGKIINGLNSTKEFNMYSYVNALLPLKIIRPDIYSKLEIPHDKVLEELGKNAGNAQGSNVNSVNYSLDSLNNLIGLYGREIVDKDFMSKINRDIQSKIDSSIYEIVNFPHGLTKIANLKLFNPELFKKIALPQNPSFFKPSGRNQNEDQSTKVRFYPLMRIIYPDRFNDIEFSEKDWNDMKEWIFTFDIDPNRVGEFIQEFYNLSILTSSRLEFHDGYAVPIFDRHTLKSEAIPLPERRNF